MMTTTMIIINNTTFNTTDMIMRKYDAGVNVPTVLSTDSGNFTFKHDKTKHVNQT